jgi:hypothetical protein
MIWVVNPGSGSWIRILDPDPDFLPIPDPRSRGSKRHWIPDPDPQHCSEYATDYHIWELVCQKMDMVLMLQRTSCLRSSTTAASLPNLLPIGVPLFRNVDLLEMLTLQKSKKYPLSDNKI